MSYVRYLAAEQGINEGLIRVGLSHKREGKPPRDPTARMAEMLRFLDDCANPQRCLPAVHVAGTSGKGSVCAGIAGILTEAGLKVGMHVTPYLQAATEKIWIADKFVDSVDFAELVEWVTPIAAPRVGPSTPASIHGMASVAIALEGFRRQNVDLIVFEAGCGGRFDLTSFVETTVAVVTNVGWDHVVSLGPTLERIAWHKAGIARPGAPLVTGAQDESLEVIRAETQRVGADLIPVTCSRGALECNRQLAIVAALRAAQALGLDLDRETAEKGYGRTRLAGRSEVMPGPGPRVILDGAHNRDKLTVAVQAAQALSLSGPRVALVGFLGSKASRELVHPLVGKFDSLVATQPRVYAKTPFPARETAKLLRQSNCPVAAVEPDPKAALERALELAGENGTVLVTGSFYLVGELRDRWYPKKQVVLERTSWPQSDVEASVK